MTRAACNDYEEASPNPPENVKSKPIGSQNAKVRAYGATPHVFLTSQNFGPLVLGRRCARMGKDCADQHTRREIQQHLTVGSQGVHVSVMAVA